MQGLRECCLVWNKVEEVQEGLQLLFRPWSALDGLDLCQCGVDVISINQEHVELDLGHPQLAFFFLYLKASQRLGNGAGPLEEASSALDSPVMRTSSK